MTIAESSINLILSFILLLIATHLNGCYETDSHIRQAYFWPALIVSLIPVAVWECVDPHSIELWATKVIIGMGWLFLFIGIFRLHHELRGKRGRAPKSNWSVQMAFSTAVVYGAAAIFYLIDAVKALFKG